MWLEIVLQLDKRLIKWDWRLFFMGAKETYTILIVDDNKTSCEEISAPLRTEKYSIVSASSGQQAIEQWEGNSPPDVVLIDDEMPEMDGLELCRRIKQLPGSEDIACIVLASSDNEAHVDAIFQAGADDCLMRPLNPAKLRQHIRHHLEWHDMRLRLKSEQIRYQTIAEVVSDYAYEARVESDGRVVPLWLTDSVKDVTGYSPQELMQFDDLWGALIYDEDRPIVDERRAKLLAGETYEREYRIKHKDGHDVWLQTYALPVFDPQAGRVVRMYGAGRNITELVNTRQELQTSRQTLEMALEAGKIGIWDWNMVTDEAYFSPDYVRMLGYEPGELESSFDSWELRIHPEDLEDVRQSLQDHIDSDTPYEVEHRLKTKSGEWRWIQARGQIINRDVDGSPLRMVGVHRDVDENRRIRDALSNSEERHRIISSTISDYAYSFVVGLDKSLEVEWVTEAFHEITGYDPDETDWTQLVHPDDMPLAMARYERLMSGHVDVTEFRIITKSDDIRWLRDHGFPVVDDISGRVIRIYGAAQDITQRRLYEDRLRHQALQLKARNDELDAFSYSVAHDLKNPIASMMGFASLIRNYYDRMSRDELLEHINLIMESGYKVKSIINALLTLAGVSQMEEAQFEALDMAEIVEDSTRRLQSMISESRAKITLPDNWPRATGYAPWIEEVWTNYISNAIKYGGRPPQIELGAEENGKMARFWIKDNGTGLSEEEQERVFTPFTRLNQIKVEGHGLGLSVVERIIHRLGGTVEVESKPGKGSKFSFTLPLA